MTKREQQWIEAALLALIRRAGMIAAGVKVSTLTMNDLPTPKDGPVST